MSKSDKLVQTLTIIISLLLMQNNGFPTTATPGSVTRDHVEITRHGIKLALFDFLWENNLTTSKNFKDMFNDFFGDDNGGRKECQRRIEDIITEVLSLELSNEAYIHCNSEQLVEAHNRIIRLRQQMAELARLNPPDYGLIRDLIGQCLYTIQAFYSTSNWIEMKGHVVYFDFGTPNKTLMEIAGPNEDTCRDCDNSGIEKTSCKDNILATDKLTSGYMTYQDVQPPYKTNTNLTTGKCGFGGNKDTENGQRTAKGGINKDTSLSTESPHHHFHGNAYFAARMATTSFLVNQATGIINELQKDVFLSLFNLRKRQKASFGFVIDVTGSMSNDIASVKRATVDIITDVLGTPNEPEEYVLCTFSDPKYLTMLAKKTTNGPEMIATLEKLTVGGGGDCPEYAMSGLLKCIEETKHNSTLFLFTDAGATDKENFTLVTKTANAKNINIQFFVREFEVGDEYLPMCSRRKKRAVGRQKRSGSDVYFQIAEATGGTVHQFTAASNLTSLMKDVAEDLFPSSTAVLDFFTLNTESTNMAVHVFNIDNTATNFKITVLGPSAASEVDVLRDSGSIMGNTNTRILFESPMKVVVTVINPSPGQYILHRLVSRNWDVNITAQTTIDFDYKILEEKESGYFYRISGNPILGKSYAVFLTIYNLPNNGTVDGLILTSSRGSEISYHLSSGGSVYYMSSVFDSESYKVGVYGHDDSGFIWKRTSPFLITPVKVELSISSLPELYTGRKGNISYTLTNKGSTTETFVVVITDNRGLLQGATTLSLTLGGDESEDMTFQIAGSGSFKTVLYKVVVRKLGETKILQEHSRTLFISPDVPPTCSVNTINGYCGDLTMENISACSFITWTGTATLTFTSGLLSLSGTGGLSIDTKNKTASPLYVEVSGDCCSPSSYLTAIDNKHNFARCHFYLGDIQTTPIDKPALTTEEKIAIGVLVGIVVAVCIALVVFVIITYRAGIKPKLDALKIDSLNKMASEPFPEKSDKTYKAKYQYPIFNNAPSETNKYVGVVKLNDLQMCEFDDFK